MFWKLRCAAAACLVCLASAAPADSIAVNGVTRTFAMEMPTARPTPLVIVLHGNTQTGEDMISWTAWPQVARREGFGVVFPDGLNHAWADLRPNNKRVLRTPPEGTDDVSFIVRLIEKFVGDGSADPKRIYVTGISNGGAMAMTMLCARADLFAAAASVINNFTDEFASACHPSRAVPILMMNGTADPLVPYEGGRGTSRFAVDGFWSSQRTLNFWRHVNGCDEKDSASVDLADRDHDDKTTVTRIEARCPRAAEVVLYRINGGGHRMPGSFSDARFPRIVDFVLGPQNHDIDGAELIWGFLKRFP
jgi:polyhydroxybutyrate depolymerase